MLGNSFVRFAIAGVINTVVGYGVFYLLHYTIFLDLVVANVGAYVVGLLLSLLQMRLWVFPSQSDLLKYSARFFSIFVISYCANLVILISLTKLQGIEAWSAQLISMVGYSLVSFFLSRKFLGPKGDIRVQGLNQDNS
jgi:putative flippase GtrA